MTRPQPRIRNTAFLALLIGMGLAVITKAAVIQIGQHDEWRSRAADQIVREIDLPAMRGSIVDRRGVPLAVSGVLYEIGIAPLEIPESRRDEVATALARLGLPDAKTSDLLSPAATWRVVPNRFDAERALALKGLPGIHLTPLIRRAHPQGPTSLPLVGRVTADGRILGGVEAEFDSILSGIDGRKTVYRDVRGRLHQGNDEGERPPVAGGSVRLSIDSDLVQVTSAILQEEIEKAGAEAGDIVVVSPSTGDVLVAVGRTREGFATLAPLTAPYEPGSIMKPFSYAAMLQAGTLSFTDSVFAEHGTAVIDGRRISDVHGYGWLTYRRALLVSSNIALVKAVRTLPDTVQYAILKGFGFGEATTLGTGVESAGLLRRPEDWTRFSKGSLAIGYEVNATPLQLALAYATLANGGVRMESRLVLEHVGRDGRVIDHPPREAGRVIAPKVADSMMSALRAVVEEGSGRAADLGAFTVAGKTGTSRAWGAGGYDGHYASFAALFPAEAPQLAIVVRMTRPTGAYYGGSVAAPVVRRVLEAMLSSADPPVDRRSLARGRATPVTATAMPDTAAAFRWRDLGPSVRLSWPLRPKP